MDLEFQQHTQQQRMQGGEMQSNRQDDAHRSVCSTMAPAADRFSDEIEVDLDQICQDSGGDVRRDAINDTMVVPRQQCNGGGDFI
jgi:hypothetical protein